MTRNPNTARTLHVRIDMATPIAARSEIHLDALLTGCHPAVSGSRLTRQHDESSIIYPEIGIRRLRLHDTWVYLASAARYPDQAKRSLERIISRKDEEDVHYRESAWTPSSGPEKNSMIPLPIVEAPYVEFWAVGRRRSVVSCLKRVRHVGIKSAHGHGQIRGFEVEAVDVPMDRVLVGTDGRAARHLPASWCPGVAPSSGRARPPYWAGAPEPIVRTGTLVPECLAIEEARRVFGAYSRA